MKELGFRVDGIRIRQRSFSMTLHEHCMRSPRSISSAPKRHSAPGVAVVFAAVRLQKSADAAIIVRPQTEFSLRAYTLLPAHAPIPQTSGVVVIYTKTGISVVAVDLSPRNGGGVITFGKRASLCRTSKTWQALPPLSSHELPLGPHYNDTRHSSAIVLEVAHEASNDAVALGLGRVIYVRTDLADGMVDPDADILDVIPFPDFAAFDAA